MNPPKNHGQLEPNIPPPTVGRIVHYAWASEGEPFAAIVTGVMPTPGDMRADLYVLGRSAAEFKFAVPFSLYPKLGSWSWPPRVK